MKSSMFDLERMVPRSVTLPKSYRRVLIVLGGGNISQGIRTLVETHMQKELEEDSVVCEELIKSARKRTRYAITENIKPTSKAQKLKKINE